MKDLILYRDASLIVCEKPVGVSSESPGLPELLGEQAGAKVWPVHRLDRGTGGVMVFALSAAGCASLQRLFQGSEVSKEYLAVVCGCPGESSGCWQDLLWHDKTRNKTYVVRRMRNGVKEALCEWDTPSPMTGSRSPWSASGFIREGRIRSASSLPPGAFRWPATGNTAPPSARTPPRYGLPESASPIRTEKAALLPSVPRRLPFSPGICFLSETIIWPFVHAPGKPTHGFFLLKKVPGIRPVSGSPPGIQYCPWVQ